MTSGPPRKPPPPPPPVVRPGETRVTTTRPLPAPTGRAAAMSLSDIPRPQHAPMVAPVGQSVSQQAKDAIAEMALGLLEEQVQARIVHYKADLETNPELDAITAGVVAQLKQLQAQMGGGAGAQHGPASAKESIRDAHERTLRGLLERVFRADAPSLLVERRMKEIMRKLARLFFQSELHEKTRGKDGAVKVIQHGEQAIFYLLMRYENRLKNELGGFDYANDEIKERTFEMLAKLAKDMQDAFLSRRSSELRRIVATFNGVLVDFCCKQLAPAVPELTSEVVTQAATFEGKAFAYKVSADAFPRFRAAFERRFMVRLVGFAEDQLIARLADTAGAEREETVQFVTDPRIFSMIVGELSEAIYEFLCNEGFLDLPVDWRNASTARATA